MASIKRVVNVVMINCDSIIAGIGPNTLRCLIPVWTKRMFREYATDTGLTNS